MEITCIRPSDPHPRLFRITPAPTAAEPARVRLEIEGGGYFSALVDGVDLLRATMAALAEVDQCPVVPTVTLDAVLDAAWEAVGGRANFNPFGQCPTCGCGLWPVDEWRPGDTRRCENCGAFVLPDPPADPDHCSKCGVHWFAHNADGSCGDDLADAAGPDDAN
ncbi:MAG: hypothetical protein KKA73_03390 [Chloroflexi bacterium]|nr:hypothetical protein [Chloroflexota bacterium]MBU1746708.1 hypothetical protein [Chloroflexota bacterium]